MVVLPAMWRRLLEQIRCTPSHGSQGPTFSSCHLYTQMFPGLLPTVQRALTLWVYHLASSLRDSGDEVESSEL